MIIRGECSGRAFGTRKETILVWFVCLHIKADLICLVRFWGNSISMSQESGKEVVKFRAKSWRKGEFFQNNVALYCKE